MPKHIYKYYGHKPRKNIVYDPKKSRTIAWL